MPRLVIAALALALTASTAAACGPDSRCTVTDGYYLAAEPDGWDRESPLPVVVYFHGWNTSPEGTFRNRAMVHGVTRRGALFVAPFATTGYWRQMGEGRAEPGRDERAYIRTVMTDVMRRWPVDRGAVLASGFSRGASMAWNVACYEGQLFTAAAPIAGGFWRTDPKSCPAGPIHIRHIHGLTDGVVPFDRQGPYNSRPIPPGLALFRALNGAAEAAPHDVPSGDERLDCTRWTGTEAVVEQCLHSGGHSIPAEWVTQGLDWMLTLAASK